MDFVDFFGLLSAVAALCSLYILYKILHYAIWSRHPSAFARYGFSPPKNVRDWYVSNVYATIGAITVNVIYIAYMLHIGAAPSLISWIVTLCIMELAFIYILRTESKHLK